MTSSLNPEQPAAPAGPVKEKFALPLYMVAGMPASTVQASTKKAQAPKLPADPAPAALLPEESLATKSPVPGERIIFETTLEAKQTAHAVKQVLNVSNAEFVTAVFGKLPENAFAAICAKRGDPAGGNWYASKAGPIDLQSPADRNNYVNSSSFYADEKGNVHARKENFAAFHVLMLDDVATKVPWSLLSGFKPSYVIETSPGNYQVGYFLAEPLTDIDFATQLKNAVIEAGLCDPGASGVARWARLPVGINSKPKYQSESGEPFRCRLARWNPERLYAVDEIKAGLGLKLGTSSTPQSNVQATAIDHYKYPC